MKKQINHSTKAYLIRGAFYLLLLIAVCAIPFALARQNAIERVAGKASFKPNAIPAQARESAPTGVVCSDYVTSTSTDTIVPGDTDTGNHCDDCATPITFPFPVSFYGSNYTSGAVESNGTLQLAAAYGDLADTCLPDPTRGPMLALYWDHLYTVNSGYGIFTNITGN